MSSSSLDNVTLLTAPQKVRPATTRRSDDALARLILASDQPEFERHLIEALQGLISFELAMISLYRDNALVEVSSESMPHQIEANVLDSYLKHTFQHSPVFQMHRQKFRNGFYLMEDLARHPKLRKPSATTEILEIDDREEVGYLTAGWPKRLKELDIALRVSERHTVQIALYRTGTRGFTERDLAMVEPIQTSLMAVCQRHWEKRARRLEEGEDSIDGALKRLGGGSLSARELQITKFLIAGVSEKDIADLLQVGAETVKTYRKRAYQKLSVSSRVELLVKLLELRKGNALAFDIADDRPARTA